jgi:hypothetical protein
MTSAMRRALKRHFLTCTAAGLCSGIAIVLPVGGPEVTALTSPRVEAAGSTPATPFPASAERGSCLAAVRTDAAAAC